MRVAHPVRTRLRFDTFGLTGMLSMGGVARGQFCYLHVADTKHRRVAKAMTAAVYVDGKDQRSLAQPTQGLKTRRPWSWSGERSPQGGKMTYVKSLTCKSQSAYETARFPLVP